MNKFIGCILLGGCLLVVLPLWATETDELGIIKKNYRNILMLSAGKADSLQADFIRIKPETECPTRWWWNFTSVILSIWTR